MQKRLLFCIILLSLSSQSLEAFRKKAIIQAFETLRKKAIIFDLDGTIINTEVAWCEANREILRKRNISICKEAEKIVNLPGYGLRRSCEILKEIAGLEDDVESLMKEKSRYALARLSESVTFTEGFLAFYEKCKLYPIKTAVATNADDHELNLIMDPLKLRTFFGQHIYGISCVDFKAKPNPAIFLYAARMIGIDPEDCVVIEDSAPGIKGAKNAGMLCIGINTANKPELLQEADIIVNGFADIALEELF